MYSNISSEGNGTFNLFHHNQFDFILEIISVGDKFPVVDKFPVGEEIESESFESRV